MRGLNLKPARVYETASAALKANSIPHPPCWYTTIGSIPPGQIMTRTQPVQHRETNLKRKVRKPSKLFMPQFIEYEEDQLRRQFFTDHPWELARPRIVLENDGRDGQRDDWSKMQQPGRPLSGESVVQRQLWLLNNQPGMTTAKAYDIARKEFYKLRHQEEVERRVTREEALWTGAYFGKSRLEIGMELEDKTYEKWKAWATKEVEFIEQKKQGVFDGLNGAEFDAAEEEVVEAVVDPEAPVVEEPL